MSKKQVGAAPGEENEPQSAERLGWFGRLRAQPGFRTASIAFVLTVVLGIGSTAAYAYWSQSKDLAIAGTTLGPVLPVPETAMCSSPLRALNRIEWSAVTNADPEARNIVTFHAETLNKTIIYSLPLNYSVNRGKPMVEPFGLSGLVRLLGATPHGREVPLKVTVTTGIVKTTSAVPIDILPSDILRQSTGNAVVEMAYEKHWAGLASFPCRAPR